MNIQTSWPDIRVHFRKAYQSNFYFSIATVGEDGIPSVTPIGTLFLNDNMTGFYFEKYPKTIPQHANFNPNICVLAVNSNKWFWLKALFKGKFSVSPAIKLYGQLAKKRKATSKEMARLQRRMKLTRRTKGHKMLWNKDMNMVREINFTQASAMQLGRMFSPGSH